MRLMTILRIFTWSWSISLAGSCSTRSHNKKTRFSPSYRLPSIWRNFLGLWRICMLRGSCTEISSLKILCSMKVRVSSLLILGFLKFSRIKSRWRPLRALRITWPRRWWKDQDTGCNATFGRLVFCSMCLWAGIFRFKEQTEMKFFQRSKVVNFISTIKNLTKSLKMLKIWLKRYLWSIQRRGSLHKVPSITHGLRIINKEPQAELGLNLTSMLY